MTLDTDPGRPAPLDEDVLDPPTAPHDLTTAGGSGAPVAQDDLSDEEMPALERPDEPAPDPWAPLSVERALRGVAHRIDGELIDLLSELEGLREAEDGLQQKLEELYLQVRTVGDELSATSREIRTVLEQRQGIGERRSSEQAVAIHRALLGDAALLRQRSQAWKGRQREAEARVRAFKENPQLAEQIAEFRKLDERMDTLDLLPEGYREVVVEHHDTLKKKLAIHLQEPDEPDDDLLRLPVATSVRADGGERGTSGRVLAVLPVDFKTHARARKGESDLMARFAFRILASLSRFVVHLGARTETKAVDLDGLLGLEVPFDDLDVPVAERDLARALQEAFDEARDTQLQRVKIETELVFVSSAGLEQLWAQFGPQARKRRD